MLLMSCIPISRLRFATVAHRQNQQQTFPPLLCIWPMTHSLANQPPRPIDRRVHGTQTQIVRSKLLD